MADVQDDPIQVAGRAVLVYSFSLFKTGEIHRLNNEAWDRPAGKLIEAIATLLQTERQGVTLVVYEGVVMINSHTLWLDKSTVEQANEVLAYLAEREAGGLSFTGEPSLEQIRQFFFQGARHSFPDVCEDRLGHLNEAITKAGVDQIQFIKRPVQLDGVGQGVRGVAALWHYAKCQAALEEMLVTQPIDFKAVRRIAQEVVDACAKEQDLLCGLPLLGERSSAARRAMDVGIYCASVGRALGMSAVGCVDLTEAGLTHQVGLAFQNPDVEVFTAEEIVGVYALHQLIDAWQLSPGLAHRVSAALEYAQGPQQQGPPYLPGPPSLSMTGQLIAVICHYLDLVQGEERCSPLRAVVTMSAEPLPHINPNLWVIFLGVVGCFPVGTLVELSNGDVAVVSEVQHLMGRQVYRQRPAPITQTPTIFVERLRTQRGQVIPEQEARVCLGTADERGGLWSIGRTMDGQQHRDLILRALVRHSATAIVQMGLR